MIHTNKIKRYKISIQSSIGELSCDVNRVCQDCRRRGQLAVVFDMNRISIALFEAHFSNSPGRIISRWRWKGILRTIIIYKTVVFFRSSSILSLTRGKVMHPYCHFSTVAHKTIPALSLYISTWGGEIGFTPAGRASSWTYLTLTLDADGNISARNHQLQLIWSNFLRR